MRHNSTPETIKRKTLHLELVKRRQLLIMEESGSVAQIA